jgi:uncharacterized membrane protein
MVVLIAFLRLAIDVGQLRYQKQQLQMEADVAVIAGALQFLIAATLPIALPRRSRHQIHSLETD